MKRISNKLLFLFIILLTVNGCGTVTYKNMKMYSGDELPDSKISKIKCTNCIISLWLSRERKYALDAKNVSVLPGTHELRMRFGWGEFGCNSLKVFSFTTKPGRTYKIYTKIRCKSNSPLEIENTWVWVIDVESNQVIYGRKP